MSETAGKVLKGVGSLASLAGQQIDMARQSKYENEVLALKTNMDIARFENEQAAAQQAQLLGAMNLKLTRLKVRQAQIDALNYMTPEEKAKLEAELEVTKKAAQLKGELELITQSAKENPNLKISAGGVSYTPPTSGRGSGNGTGVDALNALLDSYKLPRDASGIKALQDMGIVSVTESGVTLNTNTKTGAVSREKLQQAKVIDEKIEKIDSDIDELVKAPELAKSLRGEDFDIDAEISRLNGVRDSLQAERDLLMAEEQSLDVQPPATSSDSTVVPGSSGLLAPAHMRQKQPAVNPTIQAAANRLREEFGWEQVNGVWQKKK